MSTLRRSALFVDFDNIYVGLHHAAPAAAQRFAQHGAAWLRWLETQTDPIGAPDGRSCVLRRVYLNPSPFALHRATFRGATFDVVDCPSLTRHSKNGADMQIAIDIAELIFGGRVSRHQMPIDEIIVLSGDSDFLPVLRKVREYGYRSAILAATPMASAYRGAADVVFGIDAFAREALALPSWPGLALPGHDPVLVSSDHTTTLQDMAHMIHGAVAMHGALAASAIPPMLRAYPAFATSDDWLGYGGLAPMVDAILNHAPQLVRTRTYQWQIVPAAADGTV